MAQQLRRFMWLPTYKAVALVRGRSMPDAERADCLPDVQYSFLQGNLQGCMVRFGAELHIHIHTY